MDTWGWSDTQGDLWRRNSDFDMTNDAGTVQSFAHIGLSPDLTQAGMLQNNDTSRSAVANELGFLSARPVRTSTVILATFNVLAAFATALLIIWESYNREKRDGLKSRFRTSAFTFIAPTETFPFVLSLSIIFQGIVFAVVQSTGLKALAILGCTSSSQVMLPALFIVPFTQVVFAVEITIRALRRQPFLGRSKWTVPACLVILGAALITTIIITQFLLPADFCYGSLLWFVQRWKDGVLAVLLVTAATLLICSVILFWRLQAIFVEDDTERAAASRMVYYLVTALISLALMIPFFIALLAVDLRTSRVHAVNLAMVATVVVNLSGPLTGGLHLLLRSGCLADFGRREKSQAVRQTKLKEGIRVWVKNEYGVYGSDADSQAGGSRGHSESTASSSYGKLEEEMIESPAGTPTYENSSPLNAMAEGPTSAAAATTGGGANRTAATYSLYPRRSSAKPLGALVVPKPYYSEYGIEKKKPEEQEEDLDPLVPPPRVRSGTFQHRRSPSMESHTTVQIGIRFSNANDAPRLQSGYMDRVHSLTYPEEGEKDAAQRVSPLSVNRKDAGDEGILMSRSTSYRDTQESFSGRYSRTDSAQYEDIQEQLLTLSAAVYDPENMSARQLDKDRRLT